MRSSIYPNQIWTWVLEQWQATDLWGKTLTYGKTKNIHTHSANLWLNPEFSLALPFFFIQKNSEGIVSKHTPIHNILTSNSFRRRFPSLNKRDFYWTLQTALEPKLRFIAILETKISRGSNLRNSVRLNQKIPGSIKPRTRNPMKCFTVRD